MPTATEPAAPKAAPKAKAAPKKAVEAGKTDKKPTETPKKPTEASKKPTEASKKTTEASKKPTEASKKPTEASKKSTEATKKPAEAPKKPTEATKKTAGDKKASEKTTGEKKTSEKTSDKKAPAPKRTIEELEEPEVPVYIPKLPVSLAVLNTLETPSCSKVLSNLLNFSPSLGFALANLRPFKSTQHLLDQLNAILEALPLSYIEAFLKRFEELPLIPKSKLTKEHKCCVGLDQLSEQQREELKPLYAEYREKFGFPFVACARDVKATELGMMLRSHLLNDKEQELSSSLKEVKKIARLRLLEVVVA